MSKITRIRLVESLMLTSYSLPIILVAASVVAIQIADRFDTPFNATFVASLSGVFLVANALLWRADRFRSFVCDCIPRVGR